MVKAWYLTPNKKNIQVIDIPKQPGLEFFYDLLNCDGVEYLGFTDEKQNSYGIYMDEMGAFKNNPVNKCAKNLLGRIRKINLGEFDGWYIIFKYDFFDEDQDKLDMDITPQEFIDKFNRALSKPSIFSTFYDK